MGDAGLHPCGVSYSKLFFFKLSIAEEERVGRIFLLADLVCVLSAVFQRN